MGDLLVQYKKWLLVLFIVTADFSKNKYLSR